MLAKVLVKTRAQIEYQVVMYEAVVQAVRLYGSERWVVTDTMMMVL